MLSSGEKACFRALQALRDKEYRSAADQFDKAAVSFRGNEKINLLRETTKLLMAVKSEIRRLEKDDAIEIEEVFSDG